MFSGKILRLVPIVLYNMLVYGKEADFVENCEDLRTNIDRVLKFDMNIDVICKTKQVLHIFKEYSTWRYSTIMSEVYYFPVRAVPQGFYSDYNR